MNPIKSDKFPIQSDYDASKICQAWLDLSVSRCKPALTECGPQRLTANSLRSSLKEQSWGHSNPQKIEFVNSESKIY